MRKKMISMAAIAAMILTVFAPVPAVAKEKANKPLVKSVKHQLYDTSKKKWMTTSVTTYKYKKGYPTKIKRVDYEDGKKDGGYYVGTMKYKFKKGKPKSMKETVKKCYPGGKPDTYKYSRKYNKKGLLVKEYNSDRNTTTTYQYNKHGIVTSFQMSGPQSGGWRDSHVYKVKQKKGLPTKIIYPGDGERCVYTFNKIGAATKITSKSRYEGSTTTIKYKTKKGKVLSVTKLYSGYEDFGDTVETHKYKSRVIISYGKTKTTKKRYAQMINSVVGVDCYNLWY